MQGRMLPGSAAVVALLLGPGLPAASASARTSKPDLRVTSAKASFPAAAAGGGVSVRVTVRNAGKGRARATKLGLSVAVVGSSAKPLALRSLKSVHALRARRSVRLSASGVLPASVPAGTQIRVIACADAKKRVKESSERNNCRTTKPIAVTAGTTEALMLALLKAKKISRGRAALYTLQDALGDPKLPKQFRTPGDGTDSHTAIADIAGIASSLPAKDRARIAPYFLPARARDRVSGFAPKTAHASAVDCTDRANAFKYIGIPAAGGKVTVWYPQGGRFPHFSEAEGKAAAIRFAAIVNVVWPKLTKAFREPLSDANVPCINGGDASFDIDVAYLVGKLGVTAPYGLYAIPFEFAKLQTFCTATPSFISLRPDATRFAVAHELMHAIQFAYRYKSCGGSQNGWWDEGGANWAGDFVYPTDQDEHRFSAGFTKPDQPLWTDDYDAWPFWYFLTRTTGQATMNKVFASLAGTTIRPAVDAAIPGGYRQQFPIFVRHLWNQSPVGASGFGVAKSFSGWDSVAAKPSAIGDTALDLGGAAHKTVRVEVLAPGSGSFRTPSTSNPWSTTDNVGDRSVSNTLGPEAASYRHITFPDSKLRKFTFTNALYGKPGERIDAWMRLADGTWKVADWSAKETSLCRDRPAENVQELYIVSENVGVAGDGIPIQNAKHQFDAANHCSWPTRYTGTWTRVFTLSLTPGWTETVHGTATFVRNPLFPEIVEGESSIPYEVESTNVHWTVSGSFTAGGCTTTYSGDGIDNDAMHNDAGGATEMSLEDVSGKPDAPHPEPKPFYYSLRVSGDFVFGPQYHVAYSSAPCGADHDESILTRYLEVGVPNPFTGDIDQTQVEKSADIKVLAGHRVTPEDAGPAIDDTWSFTGSG